MTDSLDAKSPVRTKKNYDKPAISFEEQLAKLKERGLRIEDDVFALDLLRHLNYYRLRAYTFPYQDKNENFVESVELSEILSVYEIDKALRALVFDGIELFEIHFRTVIAYHLGKEHGPFGHEKIQNFSSGQEENHREFLHRLSGEAERSKARFMLHYREKYANFPSLPIWIATEIMSLGTLSRLFYMLKTEDKRIIAQNWDTNLKALTSWVRSLTTVRNICAHYGRLWNSVQELKIKPSLLNKDKKAGIKNDNIYFIIYILRRLTDKNPLAVFWTKRAFQFLSIHERRLMLPATWKTHPLWVGLAEQL